MRNSETAAAGHLSLLQSFRSKTVVKGSSVRRPRFRSYTCLKVGVFYLLPRFQPALIQLLRLHLLCVGPQRLNQVTFQLKLQTFPFEYHFKHQICMIFFSLNQVLESSTAHQKRLSLLKVPQCALWVCNRIQGIQEVY